MTASVRAVCAGARAVCSSVPAVCAIALAALFTHIAGGYSSSGGRPSQVHREPAWARCEAEALQQQESAL